MDSRREIVPPLASPSIRALAWRHRRSLFVAALLSRLVGFIAIWPLIGILLRLAIRLEGDASLTDADIASFLLRPIGLLAVVASLTIAIAITGLEHASLLAICFTGIRGGSVSGSEACLFAVRHAWAITQISVRLLLTTLALALPFLILAGLTGWWLLTEFDINYYLTRRPPAFWWAGGILVCVGLGMTFWLLPRILGWVFALPLLLSEGTAPRRALHESAARANGRRWRILGWILAWLVGLALLSFLNFGLVWLAARGIIPFAGRSLRVLVPLLGLFLVVWAIGHSVVVSLQSISLALLVVKLFMPLAADGAGVGDAVGMRIDRWRRPMARRWGSWLTLGCFVSLATGAWMFKGVHPHDSAWVIAHRGAAGTAPENTLAAVARAIEDRADMVEVDVQETADGEVVVFHDRDFMKLAGVPTKLWEATYAQLQDIDIGSHFGADYGNERVPKLADVLSLCKGKCGVNIELKYYGHNQLLEARVAKLVEDAGMADQIVLMSLDRAGVRRMKRLRPTWKVGLLAAVAIGDLTRVQADFLAVGTKLATQRLIRRAHSRGIPIHVWTVDDPAVMSRYLSYGVDGLITNRPDVARQVLADRAELDIGERMLVNLAFRVGLMPPQSSANEPFD